MDGSRRKTDPMEYLFLRAMALAPALGLSAGEITEAIGILETAFGREWLNEAASDASPSTAIAFRRTYLGNLVATAGPTQLGEILELTGYLASVPTATQIGTVIQGLRSDYASSMLQLATAARLAVVGATEIAFEPGAREGRLGDIEFQYGGLVAAVECFVPGGQYASGEELRRLGTQLLGVVGTPNQPVAVAVALHKELGPELRKDIVQAVMRGLEHLRADPDGTRGRLPVLLLSSAGATISAMPWRVSPAGAPPVLPRSPQFPFQGNDWDFFGRQSFAPADTLTRIAPPRSFGEGRSCCGIWLAEGRRLEKVNSSSALRVEVLGRKIERKLAQTRTRDGAPRIVVVQLPPGFWASADREKLAEHLSRKIVAPRPDVAAVILQDRQWRPELGRHGHQVQLVLGGDWEVIHSILRRYAAIDPPPLVVPAQ